MVVAFQQLDWPSTWEGAKDFARHLTDRLGCPIDEGILETVIALNLLGFPTAQSCEGHLDRKYPSPWIDFFIEDCPEWYNQAQAESCREGLSAEEEEAAVDRLMALVDEYHHKDHLYTRLSALLDAFYEVRTDSPEDWRIILHCIHPGYYRMIPDCGYTADEWPQHERAENLARAQAEMQAFTVFLKQRFFAQRESFAG
ncbi:MAG TPA: hypothetical protein VFV38_47720 [Ktedonobacteraceae bacterium]|nr:hypothetical protein [Ktedonobacteraceae bacterium]